MEGVSLRFFSDEKVFEYASNNEYYFDQKDDTLMDFHYHLSDSSIQNKG